MPHQLGNPAGVGLVNVHDQQNEAKGRFKPNFQKVHRERLTHQQHLVNRTDKRALPALSPLIGPLAQRIQHVERPWQRLILGNNLAAQDDANR